MHQNALERADSSEEVGPVARQPIDPHIEQPPNRLDIRIEYMIAGQNNKRNLVFPFYLTGS